MAPNRFFPVEVLSLIFGYIDRRNDRQSIFTLRAVSRQCNYIAKPLTYCTIEDTINQHRHLNKPQVGPLQRAAWDIVRQPELAPLIKAIRFDVWDFIGKNETSRLPKRVQPPSAEEYSTALAPANLSPDVSQTILKQLCPETPAGHLSLLLALCTDLEVFEAPAGHAIDGLITAFLPSITESKDRGSPLEPHLPAPKRSLGALREVNLGISHQESALRHILPLLSLPSLVNLSVYGLGDSYIWEKYTLPAQPETFLNHNPISLTLDSCMLSGPGLSILLGSCEKPRELTIRWRAGLWTEHLENEPIGEAIRERGDRLEFLLIDTTDVFNDRHSGTRPPGPFGTFASLSNLKTLAVPRYAFPVEGCSAEDIVDILPPKLERLYVLGVGNEKKEGDRAKDLQFKALCKEVKTMLPSLKVRHGCLASLYHRGMVWNSISQIR